MIDQKIKYMDDKQYFPMEYSKIFLSISNFYKLKNKIVIKIIMKKRKKK